MIRFFLRRLAALVPVALGVATLTFALIHLVPGDPVIAMLGENAASADIAGMRHQLGLDRPLLVQYADYLGGLMHGDLGLSISFHEPVSALIAARFPATLELAGAGLAVAIVIAFPLGLISGSRPGGAVDSGAMAFAIFGISVPHIYLGPLLMIIFSLHLGWFPLTGRGGLAHLVLPAITMGTALAGDSGADAAPEPGCGARCRFHPHGQKQRAHSIQRAAWPRSAQRANSGDQLAGVASRGVAHRLDRDRNHFFVAGNRPTADRGDRGAGLSAGPRMCTDVRVDLRVGQPRHRHSVQRGRSAREIDVTRNLSLTAGALMVAVLLMLAVLGPSLDGADPLAISLPHALGGPDKEHPLGCDALGRDMLARTLWGARISVGIAAAVVGVSLIVGSLVGATAALAGGLTDELLMRIVDVLLAFPGILLAIALAAILGPGLLDLVIALAAMGWTGYARLVRGEILSLREREYVQAARSLGASPWRLLMRHLLPGVAAPLAVQASFGIGGIIVAEAALSFLGLGIPPPQPTWGGMLDQGRAFLLVAPHLTTVPGLAIGLSVLGFNFLGDGLAQFFGARRSRSDGHVGQAVELSLEFLNFEGFY